MLGATITGIGWVAKEFRSSLKEARDGRKDEAQAIANERDQWKQKAADWKQLAETYYNNKQRVKDTLWETRRVARAHNVPNDALPPVPEDHH